MREIVFDTETTGFDPVKGDRITEIGCVEVIDYIPTGRVFHSYINPQREVPEEVTKITGLTTSFLSDKPLFCQIAEQFMEFIQDSKLIAHNASFDQKFINSELQISAFKALEKERFKDTLYLARKRFPGAYNSLDALCKRFNISLEAREHHGALIDAKLLARVYYELSSNRSVELDIFQKQQKTDIEISNQIEKPVRKPVKYILSDQEKQLHKQAINKIKKEAKTLLWSRYYKEVS